MCQGILQLKVLQPAIAIERQGSLQLSVAISHTHLTTGKLGCQKNHLSNIQFEIPQTKYIKKLFPHTLAEEVTHFIFRCNVKD